MGKDFEEADGDEEAVQPDKNDQVDQVEEKTGLLSQTESQAEDVDEKTFSFKDKEER